MSRLVLALVPMTIAAAPAEPLSTGTIVAITVAIVAVIVLRGVFVRRFTRRKSNRGREDAASGGDDGGPPSSGGSRDRGHDLDGGDSGDGGGGD